MPQNKVRLLLISISFLIVFISITCSQATEPKINTDTQFLLSQTDPQFSHDGNEIVFNGLYDSIYAVHFIDVDGNYLGYILRHHGILSSPTWSPDAKKIAVSIEGNIFTVYRNGDSLTNLINTGVDFYCNWSPDGKYIAYTKTICDPDCGITIYNMNNNTWKIIGKYGGYASWNNNSEKIYYSHNLYDDSKYKGFVFKRIDINTLKIDSLFFIEKTDLNFWLADCTISPNEEDILFSVSYDFPVRLNIWKIILFTGEVLQMTFDGGSCPAYNPEGKRIVYTNTNIDEGGLWIMNSDGSNKQQLTTLRE